MPFYLPQFPAPEGKVPDILNSAGQTGYLAIYSTADENVNAAWYTNRNEAMLAFGVVPYGVKTLTGTNATVDQNYNPDSQNAQSGIAVAQAVAEFDATKLQSAIEETAVQATNAAASASAAANSATTAVNAASTVSTVIATVSALSESASSSASMAATSETLAITKAHEAAESATNAATSEANASASANTAIEKADSAAESAASANAAKTAAESAASTSIENATISSTNADIAIEKAEIASTLAAAAASSAFVASTAAVNVSGGVERAEAAAIKASSAQIAAESAANDAESYKNEAEAAKTAAQSAQNDAEAARDAAESASYDADSYKNDAETAANDAESYKNAAEAARDAASLNATNAGNSATAAATQAEIASNSATTATASAAAAASSAETSATSAAIATEKAQEISEAANIAAAQVELASSIAIAVASTAAQVEESANQANIYAANAEGSAQNASAYMSSSRTYAATAKAAAEEALQLKPELQALKSAAETAASAAETAANNADISATSSATYAAAANESAVAASSSAAEALTTANEIKDILANNIQMVPVDKNNEIMKTVLSDQVMSLHFATIRQCYPQAEGKKYGIEIPLWPDIVNSKDAANGATGVDNNAPWRQTYVNADNTSFLRKIGDNAGLSCYFRQEGVDTEEQVDDYEFLTPFMWWRVNYIKDCYGNRWPIAIEGMEEFKLTGKMNESDSMEVDVGIMSIRSYIKVEKALITNPDEWQVLGDPEIYTADNYNRCYEKWGGVPVRRIWLALEIPTGPDGQPEEGWHPVGGCVRHDGSVAPYAIRSPYLSGWKNDKLMQQPGLPAANNVSLTNIISWYLNGNAASYKGAGYQAGTSELWTWGYLLCLLKHGKKNSQVLCNGIDGWVNFWLAENIKSTASKSIAISASNTTQYRPGVRIGLKMSTPDNNSTNIESMTYTDTEVAEVNGKEQTQRVFSGLCSDSQDNSFTNGSSNYYNKMQNVVITARTPREDNENIVDLELGVDEDFELPAQGSYQSWVFTKDPAVEGGNPTAVSVNYKATANYVTDIAWKVNPWYDEESEVQNNEYYPFTTGTTYNAVTLHGYEINGTGNYNNAELNYHYVPDIGRVTYNRRYYIQQGYPTAGSTDIILRHLDGVVGGKAHKVSPFRLGGIEFGQGLWDTLGDLVHISYNDEESGTLMAHQMICPKGYDISAVFSTVKSRYVDLGLLSMTGGQYPVEYEFVVSNGDTNYGTENSPKYANGSIFPSAKPTYKPNASDTYSYGDYFWTANSVSGIYESILGGRVDLGADCGLLYLSAGVAPSSAYWSHAVRD